MPTQYGFGVIIRKTTTKAYDPGDSPSGQADERGRFRPRFPMKPRWHRAPGEDEDFIPVWETKAQALAVVERFRAAGIGKVYAFEVIDIRIEAGGLGTVDSFRGVDGWTITNPEPTRPNSGTKAPAPPGKPRKSISVTVAPSSRNTPDARGHRLKATRRNFPKTRCR